MDGGEAEDGGLGFIGLFDDSDTSGGSSERNATDSTGSRNLNGDVDNGNRDRKKSRLEKLQQSEEAFLEQKRSWNPICQKSEVSEGYKCTSLHYSIDGCALRLRPGFEMISI